MINFPVPHPDELIYSAVARAGVNSGILSHKQLLDSVFSNRKVIATMDLPCHLEAIAAQLKGTGRFAVSELISKHTMFGLYAPFVDTAIRAKAMSLMASRSEGAVHLMLGVAASRVKTGDVFKFCPACMQSQYERYGECFWDRRWYMPSIGVCHEHGYLEQLDTRFGDHRHQFLALDPAHQFRFKNESAPVQLMEVAKAAASLLDLNVQNLPTQQQWTLFYKRIASDFGFCRGNHVCHNDIHQRLTATFSHDLLKTLNLRISMNEESCWLRAIFRKHRKAFSYLEHILIWKTLLPDFSVPEVINQAASLSAAHPTTIKCGKPKDADVIAASQVHRER